MEHPIPRKTFVQFQLLFLALPCIRCGQPHRPKLAGCFEKIDRVVQRQKVNRCRLSRKRGWLVWRCLAQILGVLDYFVSFPPGCRRLQSISFLRSHLLIQSHHVVLRLSVIPLSTAWCVGGMRDIGLIQTCLAILSFGSSDCLTSSEIEMV